MAMNRSRQFGMAIQADEVTPSTLVAGDYSGQSKELSYDYQVELTERGIIRAILSPLGMLPGGRMVSMKGTDELVGGNASIATDAPWHRKVRGMGMSVTQLKYVNIGARTGGEFQIGDVVGNNATLGSATAKGIVMYLHDVAGQDKLVILPTLGSFTSGDVVYNYATSQVSSTTSSSAANAGAVFRPQTETESTVPPCVTMEHRTAGEIHRGEACRGKGSLTLEWSKPAYLGWEFAGPCVLNASNQPVAGSAVSSIPTVGGAPMVCKSNSFKAGTYTPVLTKLEVMFDNTLAPRKTMANNDLQSSGYAATRIGDRKWTAKFDPEHVISSSFDLIGSLMSGTTMSLVSMVGSPLHTNGLLVVYAPRVQIDQNPSQGDRDGIITNDVSVVLTGDNDDELYLAHVFL